MTGNQAEAADLMQDAFLKLWERWDRVDRIADPRAYLFRPSTVRALAAQGRAVLRVSGGPHA